MHTRNIYWDNAKFILIFLVVLGHFANLNKELPIMGGLNNVIYSFHMPLFIFISGYFSRKIKHQSKSEVSKILYMYFVFEILNYLYTSITSFGYGSLNIFVPTYQNWYILGIFFWRLLIPYFNFFLKKTALFSIFTIALIIGYFKGFNTFLGLYRIFYFMPIFVLGYFSQNIENVIGKYKKHNWGFIMLLIFSLGSIFTLSVTNQPFNNAISYAYTPYTGYSNSIDVFLRVAGLISSFIIGLLVMFIIPSNKRFYTRFGERTLNVFLLHMFLVFPINEIFDMFNLRVEMILTLSILLSIIITCFLSINFINRMMKPLTSMDKLLSITKRH